MLRRTSASFGRSALSRRRSGWKSVGGPALKALLVVLAVLFTLFGIVKPAVNKLLIDTVTCRAKLEDAERRINGLTAQLNKVDADKLTNVLAVVNASGTAGDVLAQLRGTAHESHFVNIFDFTHLRPEEMSNGPNGWTHVTRRVRFDHNPGSATPIIIAQPQLMESDIASGGMKGYLVRAIPVDDSEFEVLFAYLGSEKPRHVNVQCDVFWMPSVAQPKLAEATTNQPAGS